MKIRANRTWLSWALVVVLFVLAGCEPVGGLDFNKVFVNAASVKSVEGTQALSLELVANPAAKPTLEEQRMLDLFSNVQLRITELKQQDLTNLFAKGEFVYKQAEIPFQLWLQDQNYVFQLEGAKKPIVLRTGAAPSDTLNPAMSEKLQDQINQQSEKIAQPMPSLLSYFIGWAPNPQTITAFEHSEHVHLEKVTGQKVHIEIKGNELAGLVKGFLTNLLADEQGLKDLLGVIYDLYAPIMQQAMQESGDNGHSTNDAISSYLTNKPLAVEFAYTYITQSLKKLLENYDQSMQQLMSAPDGSQAAKAIFNDSSYMKMDVLVDSNLMPRKTDMEMMVTSFDASSAIKSFKLTSTSQMWNHNQPVTVDPVDSTGALELTAFQSPARVISVIDPQSELYQLLKHDLKITKQEITMIMDEKSPQASSLKPYNRNGTVMVPIRFVVEQLDADVEWEQAIQRVTVTDPLSGAVIKLNVGSKQATVNGMIKPLETEAELLHGSTFVPVRFIAESMGAKVEWDQDTMMVTITRD
ncbi:copper amine oxidase N-terminal domain-containing protein [Paenibacillus xerothermodurans]|uniref:Copper amine oxidase N-terminal domain-containing protein n=1 Tax=Paenibacillus xerothermodurans TaxID=1977292 RepID=A0A2W1NBJ6_PAEXE|nr:copper amine oxidase N-terminal domain-containing protein [Paenibacillus xerothermodurans]PZE21294.1 copper amine oxidase N-terminal domain-containing protein [Paenibacillus xerothermodurans]